ncbi:hypothetical protein IG631_24190 [Alternaria alternata]|nr:hypothetical protein IG631_24190 [Alternaria alternata]
MSRTAWAEILDRVRTQQCQYCNKRVLNRAECGKANGVVPDVEIGNRQDERRGRCVDDAAELLTINPN